MKESVLISIVSPVYKAEAIIDELVNQIINNLLDKFCTAYNNDFDNSKTNYDSLLLKILPEKHLAKKDTLYERLLHICHFVSLLTDGNAVLYNKIITA